MAGRPTPGSTTGVLIGMISAFAVALIALVLLVVLWSNQEQLRAGEKKAVADTQLLMRPNEMQGALRAWVDAAGSRNSVAKGMNDDLLGLARMITDQVDKTQPGMAQNIEQGQLEALWTKMDSDGSADDLQNVIGQPLITALDSMYQVYQDQRDKNSAARATIKDMNTTVEALTKTNDDQQQQFDTKVAEFQQEIETIKDDWAAFRGKKESQLADLEKNTADERTDQAQQRQVLRDEIEVLNSEIDKLEAVAEEVRKKIREFQILPQERMAARQADGVIMMARPGETSVFVDLGAKDHLTLGLLFAIYSPDTGIPSSGEAKAAIEVAKIGEEVSECRIRSMSRMNPILEGDLIANPIYDRQRRLSFLVIGKYDLDHDGFDDPHGAETIAAVVRDNQGVVADELSARTDFVIVGARPMLTKLPSDATPELLAIQDDQVARTKAYLETLKEAQSLSIPLLTQETFLNFLGRPGRGT